MRFSRAAVIAVVAAVIIGLPLMAIAARDSTEQEPRISTHPTDDRVVIGYVGDLGTTDGAETLKGIRLWQAQLEATTRGVEYSVGRLAAVKVLALDSRGSARVARSAARRLVRDGATVLVGPPDERQLEAVAGAATTTRTPLISPIPRPLSVPRDPRMTFLSRPPIGEMFTAYDALDVAVRQRSGNRARRTRVAILAVTGKWAARARKAARLADARAYRSRVVVLNDADRSPAAALRSLRAFRPDMFAVFAPWPAASSWFARLRSNADPSWVIPVDDLTRATGARNSMTLTVPWSPTNLRGGPVFGPGELTTAYVDRYGRQPTVEAAAGAAACLVVSAALAIARSTDATRLLESIRFLRAQSFWGELSFDDNREQTIRHADLVRVAPGGFSTLTRLPAHVPRIGAG